MTLKQILFPEKDHSLPGERILRTTFRTVHLASMGILLGGHFYGQPANRLYPALYWTVGSGSAFVILELYCNFHWLFQIRGLMALAKIGLVMLIPLFWNQRVWILLAVLVLGSVGSHAPTGWRYYSVLTRSLGAHKKG